MTRPAARLSPIGFSRRSYLIDGQSAFLYSGEFHYFRVPRAAWRERLRLFREAGGNCVATYVPWLIHEPAEGTFDFGSAGHLDLEGFLEAAREEEMRVMVRPGPYQYSELVYGGIPRWLYDDHPSLRAKRIDGKDLYPGSISYVHPLLLEKAARWFDAVCPILARHTLARGGAVAMSQFDNELMGFHLWRGSMDFNPEAMGFGQPEGRWTRWLRNRFGSIDAVNAAYDTLYQRFEEVRPVVAESPVRPSEIRRKKDYFDFYAGTVGEYGATLARLLRERGLDVPVVHNSANPDMNALFLETVEALGGVEGGFLLGADHYYNLDQSWNQNNPTPQYAINVFYSCEMLRLMGFPPSVLELPGGSCSDFPRITPEDARACVLTNLALGMKGCNYYIFTGGPNPPGVGLTTDVYDFGASVGADGEVRPLYGVVKEIGEFIARRPWLAEAERVGDCRVALDFEQARARLYAGKHEGVLVPGEVVWKSVLRGVLTTAFCASLSPVMVDLRDEAWVEDRTTPLIVARADAMARAKQERIVRFLRGGGSALICTLLPRFDENFLPCTTLADYLGRPRLEPNDDRPVRVVLPAAAAVFDSCKAIFTEVPAGARLEGTDEYSGRPVAWSRELAGGGSVFFLGLHWTHSTHGQSQMLREVLARLGLRQEVLCSNPDVWTSLRRAGGRSILFLMNLSTSPAAARVEVRDAGGAWRELAHQQLGPMTVTTTEW